MNARGFTLLEAVISVALSGLLLSSLLPAAYALVSAAERVSASAAEIDEAAIIDRTLYWALANAGRVEASTPSKLEISGNDGETVLFAVDGTTLTVARDNEQTRALNVVFPITHVAFAIMNAQIGDSDRETPTVTIAFTLGRTLFVFRYPLPRRGLFPSLCTQP